ncbi:condensation domain-containing protein [Oceanicola sp. 22II-s10i]|uniref:condensation domain-containing protein n=1 Tax=Oceanicola sp. 22II-s10i TaxID=1317116 RepID=UPI0015959777|nr:condensation domain-containing protein [Oceanicola sp. 22II-s10i]
MAKDFDRTPVTEQDIIAEFPLSTTQTRCWFLNEMKPGNPSLNVAVRWEVRGDLQAANLERAFQNVVDRHEILRTRFVEVDGTPMQQVVEHVPFRLGLVDIRAVPADQQAAKIEEIAHEFAARPFDLGQPGLLRATLIRLSADRALLTYVFHQSVFDGFSIRVLGHEIGTAAQAYEEGRQPDLPDLPLQYGDFALWQKEYLASGVLEEESAYWLKTLDGMTYFEIEPDRPRPAVRGTGVSKLAASMDDGFGDRLHAAAQAAGVSTFAYGTGIFSACLHRMSEAQDILFGTQIAGRLDSDLDTLIGVFINNLVLRFEAKPDSTIADHTARAGKVVQGALSHQSMPFNALVERMNPARDPSRTPLISINFNLQNVFMESKDYGGFALVSSPSHAPGAIYDLSLAVMGRPTGWQMVLEYSNELFDTETAQAILELAQGAFETAFASPQAKLSELPLPKHLAERRQGDRRAIAALEQALTAIPMVREAAVVRTADAFFGFVVPGDTGTVPLEDLPGRIMDTLATNPDAQGLTGISLLGGFPRTSTGAVNRTLLRVPSRATEVVRTATARPEVLTALQADWKDILGLTDVTADAHFFDLGGHSVLVLRQLSRIRDRWDVALDVTQVYENPTLGDLARLISAKLDARGGTATEDAPTDDWQIMRLGKTGEGQPLVVVNNAATGLVLSTIGSHKRKVTCVREYESGRKLDLTERPFTEIAADYAKIVRRAQPEGPYLLYGNCVHGNLALEAARHLQADGAEIAGVVMKDVWEMSYVEDLERSPSAKWREKIHALRNRLRAVRNGELSLAAFLGSYRIVRATGVLRLASALGLVDRVRQTDLEADQERYIAFVTRMRDSYRAAPVDFPVLHIVTNASPRGDWFSPSIGWERVVAGDKLKTVHLDRVQVLRDRRIGVEGMAAEIEAFLGETQAGA